MLYRAVIQFDMKLRYDVTVTSDSTSFRTMADAILNNLTTHPSYKNGWIEEFKSDVVGKRNSWNVVVESIDAKV